MLPQQRTPRGDWRVAAEAGARAEQLTITRSNRGYLRLGHTDNWHETEVTQIYAQYFIQLDKYLATTNSWTS